MSNRAIILAGKDVDGLLQLLPPAHPLKTRILQSTIDYEHLRAALDKAHPNHAEASARVVGAAREAFRHA
jgi:hypothetical protein